MFYIFQISQYSILLYYSQYFLKINPQNLPFLLLFNIVSFFIKIYIQEQCIITGNGFTSCVNNKNGQIYETMVFKFGHQSMKDSALWEVGNSWDKSYTSFSSLHWKIFWDMGPQKTAQAENSQGRTLERESCPVQHPETCRSPSWNTQERTDESKCERKWLWLGKV